MRKFKIPTPNISITKTLRIREEYIPIIEQIANEQNISFNKVVNEMIKFAIENREL